MQVLITGGAGFLGQRLARTIVEAGGLRRDGTFHPLDRLILLDVVAADDFGDPRVASVAADITDAATLQRVVGPETASVFHLAAVVSGQAEADFDLGMRVNFDATRLLLERLRQVGGAARLVMTSSVAVFGGDLPEVVPDDHIWAPQSSYGTQKAMADLLVSDYARKGFVDARSIRLPTIVVRPGKPNLAASSFASGIIREPLHGEDTVCPVAPETLLWLMSPRSVIRNLLHAHDLPAERLGRRRVINLPGLSIRVADMIAALGRIAGPDATRRIQMQRDPKVEQIVNSWPGNFTAEHAKSLGFVADADFADIIHAFIEDERVSAVA
ncbi:MAG: D-erythronate dehydrogenase [Rhodospirillales bacterium]